MARDADSEIREELTADGSGCAAGLATAVDRRWTDGLQTVTCVVGRKNWPLSVCSFNAATLLPPPDMKIRRAGAAVVRNIGSFLLPAKDRALSKTDLSLVCRLSQEDASEGDFIRRRARWAEPELQVTLANDGDAFTRFGIKIEDSFGLLKDHQIVKKRPILYNMVSCVGVESESKHAFRVFFDCDIATRVYRHTRR